LLKIYDDLKKQRHSRLKVAGVEAGATDSDPPVFNNQSVTLFWLLAVSRGSMPFAVGYLLLAGIIVAAFYC
jgi:hypothetical protein